MPVLRGEWWYEKGGELWYEYKHIAEDSKIWAGSMHYRRGVHALCMHALRVRYGPRDLVKRSKKIGGDWESAGNAAEAFRDRDFRSALKSSDFVNS